MSQLSSLGLVFIGRSFLGAVFWAQFFGRSFLGAVFWRPVRWTLLSWLAQHFFDDACRFYTRQTLVQALEGHGHFAVVKAHQVQKGRV